MLTSKRVKTVIITRPALALIAAISTGFIASPAFAQPHLQTGVTRKDREIVWHKASSKSGRAFGMASNRAPQLDPNSPELTGGGSLGYNQKLLDY